MMRITFIAIALCMLPLLAWAQCKDCPGKSPEAGCACSEFHRYTGEAMLNSFEIALTAESECTSGFSLLVRDERGRRLAEIPLAGPHSGDHSYSFKLDQPVPAKSVRMAILVNPGSKSVKITMLKLTGMLSDGDFVYFEKSCPGVVIGADGCPRMALYEGEK